MLRNKALAVLQKTYDDSYLSCSTAVYYESQGSETEAMRHWRSALDQIYDYHANRAPPSYSVRTDTEKALQDALRELELQCKERIDLLEALRVSRQEETLSPPPPTIAAVTSTSSVATPAHFIGAGYRGWTQRISRPKRIFIIAAEIIVAQRPEFAPKAE
ncbi:hypothetical protein LRP88_10550 [Fusarium phalaenopsidis]